MPLSPASSSGGVGGDEIGYDEGTASVTVASTTEATGTTVLALTAKTFDGNPVMFEFFAPVVEMNTAGGNVIICLFEGATQIGRLGAYFDSGQVNGPFHVLRRFTPTAGSHTYTVTAFKNAAGTSALIDADVGGVGKLLPMFARFTRI